MAEGTDISSFKIKSLKDGEVSSPKIKRSFLKRFDPAIVQFYNQRRRFMEAGKSLDGPCNEDNYE